MFVGVGVNVAVEVRVQVGELVAVFVGTPGRVFVDVSVGVSVSVTVGVSVGTPGRVFVGVTVRVLVKVSVGSVVVFDVEVAVIKVIGAEGETLMFLVHPMNTTPAEAAANRVKPIHLCRFFIFPSGV